MNICLCIISNGWGGAETVVYQLARHLRDKGENVSIVLNQEMVKYYADLEGIKFFNIGSVFNPSALVRSIIVPRSGLQESQNIHNQAISLLNMYLTSGLCWVYYRRIRKELRQFLLENHIDVVQAHLIRSILLVTNLRGPKIPTIASTGGAHRTMGTTDVHPLLVPLAKWLLQRRLRQALKSVDKVREGSIFTLDAWESLGLPLKEKFIVVPNGINLPEIRNLPKSVLKLKGSFNLLFPGGARRVKGGDILIPALARVKQETPDVHLYVALEVPEDHLLRRMAKDLGLEHNITFTGLLAPGDFYRLLNTVDLLVLPSRIEVSPVVLVEAIGLGKPIVATNVGGIPELVKNGRNGILVSLDENEIADAILKLYQDESLRAAISKNNLQDRENFDWDNITEQYRELYRSLLKKPAAEA